MKTQYTIKVTIHLEKSFWVGTFERNDDQGFAVARHIFGSEPSDAECYEFILAHYAQLNFTEPQDCILIIKRKNHKRMLRDAKHEMEKMKNDIKVKMSYAESVLKENLEKNKIIKKKKTKVEKEKLEQENFLKKQLKRKEKKRGH